MNWTRAGLLERGTGRLLLRTRTGFMSKYRQCHRYSFQTN